MCHKSENYPIFPYYKNKKKGNDFIGNKIISFAIAGSKITL